MNLVLCLTEQCNLRCSYCYYKDSQSDRATVMDDSTMEAAIRLCLERTLFFKQQYMNITFFGGEPLLRKEAIYKGVDLAKAMVAEAMDRGAASEDFVLRFAINTNGTLLDEKMLDYCEKERFRMYISVDGPAYQHNISRRTVGDAGSFESMYKHLPRLSKMNTVALCTVTREHVPHLAEAVKWIHQQGFNNMTTSIDFDGKWTGEDFDKLALEYQKMAMYWQECRKAGNKFFLGTIQDKIKLRLQDLRFRQYSCHVYNGAMGVSTNGNIFPCTRFITSKENAPYVQGNVFTGFDEAECNKIRDFLDYDKQECEGCAIKHRCVAHECACTSFYTTGTIEGVSAEVCTHERMLTEICDEIVCKIDNDDIK
ncbi:radical SAM protein [Fibrobacter sp. UWR1]|uniref:radical SAM protein n=1 Tax=Fibrobacter sp. UWR1 TaxID=2135645 RepID=UPI000DACD635|nr:radical SAM protein [Fibrobacter sp. UWR1]PZW70683.1 uncharacterized protein C8E88_101170 [Fibrobacter sp. UWR1]